MSDYFIYYTESAIVCLIVFAIILINDLLNVDRQEKQVKFDRALVSFMLYFFSDVFCAAMKAGFLPRTRLFFIIFNFSDYVLLSAITYMWLDYLMAVEQTPNRNRSLNRVIGVIPFIISTVALVALYLIAPQTLQSDTFELQPAFNVFLVAVPIINIAAGIFYSVRKAKEEETFSEKRRHLYIGFFPLMVVGGGMLQLILLPNTPIFCYSCVILMLVLYINSLENRISVDPLTKLNNRGQLIRYISQKSNYNKKDRSTFVVMIDINGFKKVNDTFGHAEGDQALIIVADTLKDIVKNSVTPIFACRYGGDEFLLILHTNSEDDLVALICEIRKSVGEKCVFLHKPYVISVGAGYEKYESDNDTMQKCIQRADKNLYLDKVHQKKNAD